MQRKGQEADVTMQDPINAAVGNPLYNGGGTEEAAISTAWEHQKRLPRREDLLFGYLSMNKCRDGGKILGRGSHMYNSTEIHLGWAGEFKVLNMDAI